MELYSVITIVDRERAEDMIAVHKEIGISYVSANLAKGTARQSHLDLHELQEREKTVINAVATGPSVKELLKAAKIKMYIDIPGNGIMFAIPMKAIAGKNTLGYMTEGQEKSEKKVPEMTFANELVCVILNEGYSDMVMDAARDAGATGGTVLHAKGTGRASGEKFYGVTIAEEKDMIYILAPASKKSAIMKAIVDNCGPGKEPAAVCFSLPVSEVAGIRRLDD